MLRLLLVLLPLFAIYAMWWNAQKSYQLPGELIGQWRTSDPMYADRFFELSPGYVNFGTGGGTVTTGFIQEVAESPEAGKTLYTITYKDEDKVNQLFIYYESSRGESIRFKNQPNIVWTKTVGN